MMKLLVTSDWHIDAVTAGLARLPEVEEYVSRLCEVAGDEAVHYWLFLGDAFDPGSLEEALYCRTFARLALRLTKACKEGGVVLVGNHDVHEVERPLSVMSPLVAAREGADSGALLRTHFAEWPQCVSLEADGERPVALLALPYVSRAFEGRADYRTVLGRALKVAADEKARGASLVVASHLSLPGMTPGSEAEMPRGREVAFPVTDVSALRPDVVVQGHYHGRQTVRLLGLDVEVVGAPLRFTFGERADGERGYLLLEV